MESTLVLIKPSGIERSLIGDILSRFQKKGLIIAGLKMMKLDENILRDRSFFPMILASMMACPVIAICLKGKDAIEVVRNMVGSTDASKAAPGTIRGDFSMSSQENIVHASDSAENAAIEIRRFFQDNEIFDYKPDYFRYLYAPDGK